METVKVICFLLLLNAASSFILEEKEESFNIYDNHLDKNERENTLVLLHVMFRHGNRTPDKFYGYATDPYANATYYPIGHGQLTIPGKKTAYNIGSYLRKTYGTYLGKQYTPYIAYSRATDFKRTKMTLELVLASLYPPTRSDIFKEGLYWQPIPYVYEKTQDYLLASARCCLNYIASYAQYQVSDEAMERIEPYRNLYEQLSNYTGNRIKFPSDVLKVYATLQSEQEWGFELPAWTDGLYPDTLEEAGSVDYVFQTATPYLKQMSSGFLLKKILEDTKAKINGNLDEEIKIFLYSAHEYNIATMLRVLDVFYPHVPPFGATIFFEVHKINGVYGFKIYYQDYSCKNPKLMTIPGCKSFCPYDKFVELMQINLPTAANVCVYSQEM